MRIKKFLAITLISLTFLNAKCKKSGAPTEPPSVTNSEAKDIPILAPTPIVEPKNFEPIAKSIAERKYWQRADKNTLPDQEQRVALMDYFLWICDYESLFESLPEESGEIALAFESGVMSFKIEISSTMSAELAKKFPEIKSYKGTSNDGLISARIDFNSEGLFVEYALSERKTYLSPLLKSNKVYYAYYDETSVNGNKRDDTFK